MQASDQAFPLTDVQYSYWVGRGTDQPMGGVDCHAYYEFEGKNVNAAKLKAAWDTVLAAHPMLHTRFTADGKQQTMPAVYPNTFSMLDLSAFAEDMQEEKLLEVRHALSHRRFDLEFGETAGIKHCICSGGRSVTCIDFALIVCDVQSIKIVLRDLAACYAAGKTPEVDHNWNFGAYMEMLQKNVQKKKHRQQSTGKHASVHCRFVQTCRFRKNQKTFYLQGIHIIQIHFRKNSGRC